MLALGIEGTAHTLGVGIVRHESDGSVSVLADRKDMLRPEKGGIHPREAAVHHAELAGPLLVRAFADAGLTAADLDVVAFSQGPGLGPCLRTAATAARAVALTAGKPLVGVNHCVAHLEIGRALTAAEDPVLLYASGGNTQVIAYTGGRSQRPTRTSPQGSSLGGKYRVFGETLDVGVGNALDKFAREVGFPFPGGPEIERIARDGSTLLDVPYTVKGMDVAFSGLVTAALAHVDKGAALPDVCFTLQETAFAMLVEVTERALAHTEKTEVVLGGGVACNERLWEMTERMCADRGARAYRPPKSVLVDNGVMIAHLGLVQFAANGATPLEASGVDQRQRTDAIDVTWRPGETRAPLAGHSGTGAFTGAEAVVEPTGLAARAAVRKTRVPKAYRFPELDRRLRGERGRAEARLLVEARRAGVATPLVWEVDPVEGSLVLERVEGAQLKELLDRTPGRAPALLGRVGTALARLHAVDVVHGDLTTSNVLVTPTEGVVLIDFGLGAITAEPEAKGTDLHVLMEALEATHAEIPLAFDHVRDAYLNAGGAEEVTAALDGIVRRGRYRGT